MSQNDKDNYTGKAKGGRARALSLSPKRRSEIAKSAAASRVALAKLPKATHGSAEKPLRIADIELPCYVLEDGTRVLSQSGLQTSIGMSLSGGVRGVPRVLDLLQRIREKGIDIKDLDARIKQPIIFRPPHGGNPAYGFEATVLADVCDILLAARSAEVLAPSQLKYAERAEILVRGFARVGIIALIDEVTGFQAHRVKNDLARILEAFVAKELQPYLKTFPPEYYQHLFRLYGLQYPPKDGRPQDRPLFIGKITNNVVYARLAPALLPELKKSAAKFKKKTKLHQWLTSDAGHPKLREHLASIVTLLKLSKNKSEFFKMVNKVHPKFSDKYELDLEKD